MSSTTQIPSTEPPSMLNPNLLPAKNIRYIALPFPLQHPPSSIPVTMTANSTFKPPCRRCLRDASPGETLTLTNYDPFPSTCTTPYRGSTAIFIHATPACEPFTGDNIPTTQLGRLMSLRVFDAKDMLVAAEVVDGYTFEETVRRMLADEKAQVVYVYNAKPGCYAFSVVRDE